MPLALLLSMAGNYFTKLLVDSLVQGDEAERIASLILSYTVFMIAVNLLSGWLEKVIQSSQYYFQFRFHYMKTDKLMHTDYCNVESTKGMEMQERAGYGQEGEGMLYEIANLYKSILGIFLYGGAAAVLNPVAILVIAAAAAVNFLMVRHGRKVSERIQEKDMSVSRKRFYLCNLSYDYHAAKDIKMYGMRGLIRELAERLGGEQLSCRRASSLCWRLGDAVEALCYFLTQGAVYFYLIHGILGGRISAGDFVFLYGMTMGLSEWINSIITQTGGILQKSRKVSYLRQYLDMEEFYNHGKGVERKPADGGLDIRLEDVGYSYSPAGKQTLSGIRLHIRPGEKVALVGKNGAGKTTLVKILCGLYFPTKGQVLVDGHDSRAYNIEDYYSLFSPVFQDLSIIGVTVERFVGSWEGRGEIDKNKVEVCLKKVGFWQRVQELPKGTETVLGKGIYEDSVELSGGELQKLLLARALYKDAPIVVLDEPSSALDPIAEQELYEDFYSLAGDKTVIFISHRLASTRFCDRIIFMEDGAILEEGNHDELMEADGEYACMFRMQSTYYREVA